MGSLLTSLCSHRFQNIEAANTQLLSPGWRWFTADWEVPSHNPDVLPMPFQSADRDSLGWMYNVDFSSYSPTNRGVPTKGMTHFVRRRRILRTMIFDGMSLKNCLVKRVLHI